MSGGADLALAGFALSNRGGRIHAGNDGTIALAHIDNSGGVITSGRDLSVQVPDWAGAATGSGYGNVTAGRDLSVQTAGDQNIVTSAFAANRDLLFATTGSFTNSGLVQAQGDATVSAASASNSGSLVAGGRLSVTAAGPGGVITNIGDLIGGSVWLIAPTRILNTGPKALIGASDPNGQLVLLSDAIVNADDTTATDTAPTATILGLGQVALAGALDASGKLTPATEIVNRSALLQSGGDMLLSARNVTNARRTLTMSSSFDEQVSGADLATLNISLSGRTGQFNTPDPTSIGGVYIDPPHGGLYNSDYLYTTYTGVASQNAVRTISPMARIAAGGDLTVAAGTLRNRWSQVASSGNMDLSGVAVDQDSWRGAPVPQIRVAYSGDYVYRTYRGWIWTQGFCDAGCDAPGDTRSYTRTLYESSLTANGTLAGTGATLRNGAASTGITAPAAPLVSVVPPVLPDNGLFRPTTDPRAHFLIQTSPRFAGGYLVASSDVLITALGLDPEALQKRLGDGYYEQRLVQEQINRLTGRQLLGDFSSVDEEYRVLMDNAVTVAKDLGLRPGVALAASQLAQLTSDIVWLVSETVTLADGTHTTVLVPQVYLSRGTQTRLQRDGALIAARTIDLTGLRGLTNGGTIEARQDLTLQSQAGLSSAGGTLSAGRHMVLYAANNIDLGSAVVRAEALDLRTGGDLNFRTLTSPGTSAPVGKTVLKRQASIAVTGPAVVQAAGDLKQEGAQLQVGGDLQVQTGGTWSISAVQTREAKSSSRHGGSGSSEFIQNTGSTVMVGGDTTAVVRGDLDIAGSSLQLGSQAKNQATFAVGGSVNLAAVTDSARMQSSWNTGGAVASKGSTHSLNETVKVASLVAGGSLTVVANKDVNLTGSQLSAQGTTSIAAGDSIRVNTAQERNLSTYAEQFSRRGVLGSRSGEETRSSETLAQVGSSIGGATVDLRAGKDLTLQGSNIVSDRGTSLVAGHDVQVLTASNQARDESSRQVRESGLMSNGGLSVSVGRREQSQSTHTESTTALPSTVGAIYGDVSIRAGQQYTQMGSDVIASGGSVDIQARQVQIQEGRESHSQSTETKFSQSGLTVGLTSTALMGLQAAREQVRAVGQTSDGRMQALGSAAAAMTIRSGVADTQKALGAGDKTGGLGLSISIGSSHSSSQSSSHAEAARNSSNSAAGDVRILASGAGPDSNLLIQGGNIAAGGDVSLNAEHQVLLQAAANSGINFNQSSSSGAGIGLGFNLGLPSSGLTIQASASRSKENGSGADLGYTNSHVQAGRAIDIRSGGDTLLKGASVVASQVTADIGGKLEVESLQDRSTYHDRGTSSGFSVSVPLGAGVPGASVSMGRIGVDSTYQSVGEQSAIRAGDRGFQIRTQGGTALKGGAITSTQAAVDQGLNRLETQELVARDLLNTATYQAQNAQATFGVGASLGGSSVGIGRASGNATSVTLASVSGIAGNKDARSGDAQTGLQPIFDQSSVRQDVAAQATVTAGFGQQAARAIGDYAQAKLGDANVAEATALLLHLQAGQALGNGRAQEAADLQAQADTQLKQAQALRDAWGDSGSARVAFHAIAGALTGSAGGAAGAASSAVLAPQVAQLADQAGLPTELKQVLVQGASAIAGAALGGAGGAAAAVNEADNNYLYHYRGKIIARDEVDNDKIINLSDIDLRKLAAGSPQLLDQMIAGIQRTDAPILVSDSAAQSMTNSTIQDLKSPNDRAAIGKESDMGYVNINGQARVFVQTGMDNSPKDAGVSAVALSRLLGVSTGYINNGTEGIAGDVGEYLPNTLSKKDVLNEYTYRTLNAQGPTLIITHSAGNEDARKALQAGALYGHSYENLSFFSVGSPVSSSVLDRSVTGAGATYLGQVNDWRDPVTYSKTAGTVGLGSLLGGIGYGAFEGCKAGASASLLGCILGAGAGAMFGGAPSALGLAGLQNYHPFQQYLAKPQSQSIMFNWLKKNPKGN